MLIPAEGENIICLTRVVALYREGGVTKILRADGTNDVASFTPQTLKKRGEALWEKYAVLPAAGKSTVNFTEELHIDG